MGGFGGGWVRLWVGFDGWVGSGWVGWRWQWVGVWDVVGRWWVVFFVFYFCISVLVVVIRVVVG